MGRTKADYPLKDFYSDIYPSYDRVNRIFTFGRDRAWRRLAASACLETGPARVLDLCTGTGDLILEVARQAGEGVSLTGYDFSGAMLNEARRKHLALQEEQKIPPVEFLEGDVGSMPFEDDFFDAAGITFGIRNLVYMNTRAKLHLAEIVRVIRPGGKLVILESSRPASTVWRFINGLYLQFILPYLGGMLSGNLKAYRYLARSSRNYYSIGEMVAILEEAGFRRARGRALFLGSVMLVVAEK